MGPESDSLQSGRRRFYIFLAVRNQADNDIYFITTSEAEQLFSSSLTLTCDPDVPGRDALCQRCAEEGGGGGGGGESALVLALLRRKSVLNAAAG